MRAVKNHTDGGAGGGQSSTRNRQRQRVFDLVRGCDEALDAVELAAKMGLHITTVRFHLDALCSDGVVERTRMARTGVGRPRTGYRAVRERLDYRSLAETLAVELGDTDRKRRRRSEAIGARWAKRITDDSANTGVLKQQIADGVRRRTALEERTTIVAAAFARMGFGSEIVPTATSTTGEERTILLHRCPIRDLARVHPEVACAMHDGLLKGLLADPIHAALEPFIEPELCRVKVIAHD